MAVRAVLYRARINESRSCCSRTLQRCRRCHCNAISLGPLGSTLHSAMHTLKRKAKGWSPMISNWCVETQTFQTGKASKMNSPVNYQWLISSLHTSLPFESQMGCLWPVVASRLPLAVQVDRICHCLEARGGYQWAPIGQLVLHHQTDRSQLTNKEKVIKKLLVLLKKSLKQPKRRKKTKPSKASIQESKKNKKVRSDVKATRKKIRASDL